MSVEISSGLVKVKHQLGETLEADVAFIAWCNPAALLKTSQLEQCSNSKVRCI